MSAATKDPERTDSDAPESDLGARAEENGFSRAMAAWADFEATLRAQQPRAAS